MRPAYIKTTAIFAKPFRLAGLDEVLPAGEYPRRDRDRCDPHRPVGPAGFGAGLGPDPPAPERPLRPGLARKPNRAAGGRWTGRSTVDKLSGRPLADMLLDGLLADPMVRLVMAERRCHRGRHPHPLFRIGTCGPEEPHERGPGRARRPPQPRRPDRRRTSGGTRRRTSTPSARAPRRRQEELEEQLASRSRRRPGLKPPPRPPYLIASIPWPPTPRTSGASTSSNARWPTSRG